ncbi:MAG: DUF4915 domain-containing protein, partial [Cyanobacteria bacterium P01_F01_bin.86]
NDQLWLLNSGTGEFGHVDFATQQFVPVTFCPGFVRGLAFWQNFAFVGLSKLRLKPFTGLALEERLTAAGQTPQCGLMVINLNTGQVIHWLRIEGVVEELFDVVVLPGVQRPQSLGFQSDEIERLVTFPGSQGVVVTKPTVKRPSVGGTAPRAIWDPSDAAVSNQPAITAPVPAAPESLSPPPPPADATEHPLGLAGSQSERSASTIHQARQRLNWHPETQTTDDEDAPLIWLASYPRSGSTLIRTILWHCFGLPSASLYPHDLGDNPELHEAVGHIEHPPGGTTQFPAGSLRLIKTHEYPIDQRPAIYVVRDGHAVAASFYQFYNQRLPLRTIIEGQHRFGTWAEHLKAWQPWERAQTLLLRYEDLIHDLDTLLPQLSQFLQRDRVASQFPPRNDLAQMGTPWVRPKTDWRAQFSTTDLATFERVNGDMMRWLAFPSSAEVGSESRLAKQEPLHLSVPSGHPQVSLVMTVYNTEAYLAEALDSLLAQTFTNWELILWDDGSTDESVAIAQSYAQPDSRIRFYQGYHRGRVPALIEAHALTQGDYVGWLDADDRLAPTALEETVAFLDAHPEYGMVYTHHIDMDAQGNPKSLGYRCQIPYRPHRLLLDLLTFHFRLMRQSVFDAAGRINPKITCAEDYDVCLRIEEVSRIYHLERPLYFYRINPQSISHHQQARQREASEWAVNQALERRGLAQTYALVSDEATGKVRIQRRPEVALPEAAKAQFEAGQILVRQGRLAEAITNYQAAIQLAPDYVAAHNQLGKAQQQLGDPDAAIATFQLLLAFNSKVPQAHCNLGAIWQLQGQPEAAIAAYQQAIALKPDFAIAHLNLANLLHSLGQSTAAADHYRAVIQANPQKWEAHYRLGHIAREQEDFQQAQQSFQQVVALRPYDGQMLNALAQLYEAQGDFGNALKCYQTLFTHQPEFRTIAALQISYIKRHCCDWQDDDTRLPALLKRIAAQVNQPTNSSLLPLSLSLFPASPALHRAVNEHYAAHIQQEVAALQTQCTFEHPTGPVENLRIGYLSPDFRHHPVGLLLQNLFQHHDRQQFTVYGYALKWVEDEVQAHIKAGCDEFVDLSQLATEAAARRIHADGIHILIDLAGYTTHCRPAILALRPAPIQCSFLGYPDTTGASWIDYLLTDDWIVPPDLAAHYSEEVIYLPHQFVASPDFASVRGPIPQRADQGLPDDAFIFCCFNNLRKIDPTVFAVWMRILQRVPEAVLWLSNGAELAKTNLKVAAQAQGIDPQRLVFASHQPFEQYLARHHCADLFLDTFTYNAGSTAVCALAAGLPLLTQPGPTNASRMGTSLCASAGLESLICDSDTAYEQTAVHLATHPDELATLRQTLQNRHNQPLFQPRDWIAQLEECYWKLWGKR